MPVSTLTQYSQCKPDGQSSRWPEPPWTWAFIAVTLGSSGGGMRPCPQRGRPPPVASCTCFMHLKVPSSMCPAPCILMGSSKAPHQDMLSPGALQTAGKRACALESRLQVQVAKEVLQIHLAQAVGHTGPEELLGRERDPCRMGAAPHRAPCPLPGPPNTLRALELCHLPPAPGGRAGLRTCARVPQGRGQMPFRTSWAALFSRSWLRRPAHLCSSQA